MDRGEPAAKKNRYASPDCIYVAKYIDYQPQETFRTTTITHLTEILKTSEDILLHQGKTSPGDVLAALSLIHALATQALEVDQPARSSVDSEGTDHHDLEIREALRALSSRPEAIPYRQGWRIEFCRKMAKTSGDYSIYAQYRKGSGANRQSKYIGVVHSGFKKKSGN